MTIQIFLSPHVNDLMSNPNIMNNMEMSEEEKDRFWEMIYKKISEAIEKKYLFAVIFDSFESGGEEYSVIVQREDFKMFLDNFLLWSEGMERYETCSEIQGLIKKMEEWKKESIDS